MARNLDTTLLRAFVAVAEYGGMTAAAGQLHLTQAAVSQQIKRLEEQLGVELFARNRRGLSRTTAGDRLYTRARHLLSVNDEIWSSMTHPEFEGEVSLGVPHDIVRGLMPDVLKRFNRSWPRVQLCLDCSSTFELLEKLARGELDMTLTTESSTPAQAKRLLEDPLVWVGAPFGEAHLQSPLPVAIEDGRCAFRPAVIEALGRDGRDWRSVCENGSMEAMIATIKADLAIGAIMKTTVPRDLVVLPDSTRLPSLPVFYVNMYLPRVGAGAVAIELARHIEDAVLGRQAAAA